MDGPTLSTKPSPTTLPTPGCVRSSATSARSRPAASTARSRAKGRGSGTLLSPYKNYSDTSTVRACYAYDGAGWAGPGQGFPNSVGHLTASWRVQHDGTVVAAEESNDFDAMGRVTGGRQCTPGTCGITSYPFTATYGGKKGSGAFFLWETRLAVRLVGTLNERGEKGSGAFYSALPTTPRVTFTTPTEHG